LSLEELLAKKKAEEELAAKPKFLTKEERAELVRLAMAKFLTCLKQKLLKLLLRHFLGLEEEARAS
jgi:hypothetical protein